MPPRVGVRAAELVREIGVFTRAEVVCRKQSELTGVKAKVDPRPPASDLHLLQRDEYAGRRRVHEGDDAQNP